LLSKILAIKTPLPLGISKDLPGGGYGFFLDLHNVKCGHTDDSYFVVGGGGGGGRGEGEGGGRGGGKTGFPRYRGNGRKREKLRNIAQYFAIEKM